MSTVIDCEVLMYYLKLSLPLFRCLNSSGLNAELIPVQIYQVTDQNLEDDVRSWSKVLT